MWLAKGEPEGGQRPAEAAKRALFALFARSPVGIYELLGDVVEVVPLVGHQKLERKNEEEEEEEGRAVAVSVSRSHGCRWTGKGESTELRDHSPSVVGPHGGFQVGGLRALVAVEADWKGGDNRWIVGINIASS